MYIYIYIYIYIGEKEKKLATKREPKSRGGFRTDQSIINACNFIILIKQLLKLVIFTVKCNVILQKINSKINKSVKNVVSYATFA